MPTSSAKPQRASLATCASSASRDGRRLHDAPTHAHDADSAARFGHAHVRRCGRSSRHNDHAPCPQGDRRGRSSLRLNALAPSDFDEAPVPSRRAAPIATNGDQPQHRDASRLGVRCHEDCPARRALTRPPARIRRRTPALWTSCGLSGVGRHARCDRPLHHHDRSALRGCLPTAANVLQTSDRRNSAKPGETTHTIPCVFGVSCPCLLDFAEHEPIGETGSMRRTSQ
jgi:hypothetical protein